MIKVFLELENEAKKGFYNTNSLWVVEKERVTRGGITRYNESIRLRHLNSGKYLSGFVVKNKQTSMFNFLKSKSN
jgi:hypothetical protein